MRYLTMPILVVVALMLSTAPVHADLGDQVFKLLPEDGAPTDWFGMSVAISGTVGIGGAPFHVHKDVHPGSAYLFNTTTGEQIAELLPNDADGSDWFGWSVAISGTKALVGAIAAGNGGFEAAFIFDISDPTNPIQILQLLSEDGVEDDAFGWSVAISGDIAIVGARLDDDNGTSSGSAYLFDTTTGEQIAKLLPNDGAEAEEFGWSVAINGAIAIVGAADNNQLDIGTDTGAVYFFNTTTGQQITKLLPIDNEEGDQFGNSVAISGNTAIIGAYGDDSAYLFDISSPFNPVQIAKLLPDDGVANGNFGWSVAISDATAIVGAPSDDDNGPGSGSAYLFDSTSGQQITKLLAEDGALQDHFGHSVAISGTTAIISAPIDDDNGLSSGSAYIFEGVGILRVDVDAPPGGDGLSWGTAYRFIQDALADAAASGGVDEIRAAQGTYKPDQSEANPSGTGNRETKFQMLHGLALVGGYAGIGAKDPNVRDYELYQTILSGDIGEIDLIDDNSYHVISASGANQTVLTRWPCPDQRLRE